MFERRPLSEVSIAIRDGTHGTHARSTIGVPLLSAKNITPQGSVFWDVSDDRIAESEYRLIHSNFQLQAGDLLLTIVGTLGRRAIYQAERVTFQRSVAYIRPDPAVTTSSFLFHAFGHSAFTSQLKARSNATAQAGLYLGELGQTTVPVCSIAEQSAITCILDTLDTQIEKTQALIAKLEQVKEGLLHDLLTRGIDENGELRPSPEEAPELYEQSPLGLIPREWSIVALRDVIEALVSGQHIETQYSNLEGKGVPYFTGPTDFSGSTTVVTSFTEWPQVMCRRGDLLITVKGSGCGKVALSNHDACISRQLMAIRVNRGQERFWLFVFQRLRERLNRLATGGNIPGLSRSQILDLSLPLPISEEERHAIGDRISATDALVDQNRSAQSALASLKVGFMDDLLTGRVRVTSLLEREAAETS